MQVHTVWKMSPPPDDAAAARLERVAGISRILARLLVARGFTEPAEVRALLRPDPSALHDPWLLPDMDRAVARLSAALAAGETVAVYGDYDVDGQTSVALLVRELARLGLSAQWYIPARQSEGYGLNVEAVERLAAEGVRLLITVDCGIQSLVEVARANALGMDVIVTDHHEPGPELPDAVAVVNPKRADSRYPFRELAGVGVTYKLLTALGERLGRPVPGEDALELVALGTIADVCPLLDENRPLVRAGLDRMRRRPSVGVAALARAAGIDLGRVNAGHVAFGLAPRLNAAGRISHARAGVQLLLSADESEAAALARQLDEANRARQQVESEILDAAVAQIKRENLLADWVLVVAGEGWHPGVIGIVAARLVERFARPAVVIALEGDEGKGSARSIQGFDLFAALSGCADLLVRFGGHAMAAGLTVTRSAVPALRERLNRLAAQVLGPADLLPKVHVDLEVGLEQVDEQLVRELEALAPFGPGNPTPVLAARGVRVLGARTVGAAADHLKLTLRCHDSGRVLEAIAFGAGALLHAAAPGSELDVAFTPQLNEGFGPPRVELLLRSLRAPEAGAEVAAALEAKAEAHRVESVAVLRPGPVPVADRRERAPLHPLARTAYMAALAATGARIVALTGVGDDPHALAWAAGAMMREETPVVSGLFPVPALRVTVVDGTAVAADGEPLVPWPGRGHLILFGLPEDGEVLWRLLAAAALAPGWTIHLAYGEAVLQQAAAYLERRYPGQESLRWVYRALMALAERGRGVVPSSEAVVSLIQERWPGLVTASGVEHALAVFAELGLVRGEPPGPMRLAPRPAGKVDVGLSARYNDGVKRKQAFAALSRMAMTANPARLIALAAERSDLDGLAVVDPRGA
ncbi:MAG: single-stranded-DNA-specific exonuclease RecJ [Firmicutes bacterium ZCTH02-B6]|nr:MAG: single-stranded-DNA-specific exonuclease RecJ [Firmicutes bacterium ZCTH02-B6]